MDSQQISKIIRSRIQGSAVILILIVGFGFYALWNQWWGFVLLTAILAVPALALCIINARNYPKPKQSYRKLNKLFYVDLMRISTILGLLSTGKNIVDAGVSRSLESLEEAGLEAAGSAVTYRNMRRGEMIEAYFKQLQPATMPAVPAPSPAPIQEDLQARRPAAATITAPISAINQQHAVATPQTVKTPWVAIALIGAIMPTLLIFLLVGALISSFSFGSSTFLLYSGAYGLNTVIGPLILIGPYVLVIAALSWTLSFILKKLGIVGSGMLAIIIVFSAGAVDIICLGLNLGFALSEIFVTIFGLLSALGALYITELPYGKTKVWIQRAIILLLLITTYIGARLYWTTHH